MWTLSGTIVHGKTRSYPKKVLSNHNTPEKCYEGLLRNGNDAVLHGRTQTYKRESDRCPKCGQTYSVSYLPVHMRECYEPSTPRKKRAPLGKDGTDGGAGHRDAAAAEE